MDNASNPRDQVSGALKVRVDHEIQRRELKIDSNTTIVGCSAFGTTTSQAKWQLFRDTQQGTTFLREFADDGGGASMEYKFKFDDHATLFGPLPFADSLSIDFDGINDYLESPNSSDFDFERTQSFSFSFWLKPKDTGLQIMWDKQTAGGAFRGYSVLLLNEKVRLVLRSTVGTNEIIVEANNTIVQDAWVHVVVTYDGSSTAGGVNIYYDSVIQAKTTASDSLSATTVSTVPLRIGARVNNDLHLQGRLNELGLWNKELNQTEINDIYNSGKAEDLNAHSAAADLILWARADGSTFPTVSDNSTATGFSIHDFTMNNMLASDFVVDVP